MGTCRMKTFFLHRLEDASGVAGTGLVAQGVIFDNDKVALTWLTTEHTSVAIYDSLAAVEAIHGHGGKTKVMYFDPATTPNVGRLLQTLRAIENNPQTWKQDAWRCKTGMCFAGWTVELAGMKWKSNDPYDFEFEHVITHNGQEKHVEYAAQEELNINSYVSYDLFQYHNDINDIKRIIGEIINEVIDSGRYTR